MCAWRKRAGNRAWFGTGGIISVILLFGSIALGEAVPNNPERLPFTVKFKDEVNPYRVLGVFVMPAEEVEIECVFTNPRSRFIVSAPSGDLSKHSEERWRWMAPADKGFYPLTITDTSTDTNMTLNVFVMVPFSHQHEQLNGYRIGRYQAKPLNNNPVYTRPQGFVEVTAENRNVPVSPHFTLGEFVAKQGGGSPKYLLLRERLLLKLEMILEAVNEEGIAASGLHIMSGFRTPFYNRSIGNRTVYSRHLYGGAADVYIDMDGDNYMDDLNGDGKITIADAIVLADIVESKARETWYGPFIGGLGVYGPKPHRGPYVHIDVRGYKARWTNP